LSQAGDAASAMASVSAVVFPVSNDHTTMRWKWFGYSLA
jgi:hypothetical protein